MVGSPLFQLVGAGAQECGGSFFGVFDILPTVGGDGLAFVTHTAPVELDPFEVSSGYGAELFLDTAGLHVEIESDNFHHLNTSRKTS